jgi:hypothetical protein
MSETNQKRRFGMDPRTGKLAVGPWQMAMPQSRAARITVGWLLVCGGFLGFLPVLGFWMVPLGLLVLSNEIATVRKKRRKLLVWWQRRKR